MDESIATVLLVFARVSGLVLIVPGISQSVVSIRMRLVLITLLSAPILCVVTPIDAITSNQIPSAMLHELVVGVSLGLVPAAIFFGLQVAVQAMHGMTGLPGAGEASSLGSADAVVQRFFVITVLAVFFACSGHRLVFQSVLDSFTWLPLGKPAPLASVGEILLDMLSASFELGVRAMSPIAASLAVGLLALAALNRFLPQLGYFAVGMSVQTMVLIGALFLFGGSVVWMLENSFVRAPDFVHSAWQQAVHR